MIGKTIGKYRIVGHLGRGGMGTVYRAVDETLDRVVAIKILNPDVADDTVIARFLAEATALARLNHPEIATIFELFRSESDLLMVMEYVRGETLDKVSQRLGVLSPDHAAYLIDKVLSGLAHAHRAGVVHCDIKPANLMITELGGVKVMDFGVARVRGAGHPTIDGYLMGTPAYMPPEQVLGEKVDGRADLYAVGVVLYRLLTGALPFEADTAIGTVQKQISDAPTPLHIYRKGLPDWCEHILERALAKSAAERFQTAEEFRETLAATGMVTTDVMKAYFMSVVNVEVTPLPSEIEKGRSGARATVVLTNPERRVAGWVGLALMCILVFLLSVALWQRLPASEASVPESRPSQPPAAVAAGENPAARAPSVKETAVNALPPVVFNGKALVTDGDRQRERDCRIVLANGRMSVQASDDREILRAVPLDAVISISYARARHPLWNSPGGPAEVTRVGRGALGIFSGARQWVSVRVKNSRPQFVVLRFDDEAVARRAIAALEDRTGHRSEFVKEREEDR
jgi:serine/threonine protein kinase